MKKILKMIGKVFVVIMIIVALILVILIIKGKIDERKPYLMDDYYKDFKSDSAIEAKYSGRGDFETAYTEFASDNKSIKTCLLYTSDAADD